MTYLSLDSAGEVVQSDRPLPAPGCSAKCSTRTHGHCGGRGCSPHRWPDVGHTQDRNSVETRADRKPADKAIVDTCADAGAEERP